MSLHHRRKADFPIRAVPLDIRVYGTGLLAADRLAPDLVAAMRDAFVEGHHLQREQPELGLAAFRRKHPDVSEEHLRANWALFEPNAFGSAPGSMEADVWRETIEYTAATHGLSVLSGDCLYRPELLAPALAGAAA